MSEFGTAGERENPGRATSVDRAAIARAAGRQRDAAKPVRLRGTVRDGVERGSRVLLDDTGAVLAQLMGGPPGVLTEGSVVTVIGVFRRDLLTTVQQGAPFQVQDATSD